MPLSADVWTLGGPLTTTLATKHLLDGWCVLFIRRYFVGPQVAFYVLNVAHFVCLGLLLS